jgi:hypothetical protein
MSLRCTDLALNLFSACGQATATIGDICGPATIPVGGFCPTLSANGGPMEPAAIDARELREQLRAALR